MNKIVILVVVFLSIVGCDSFGYISVEVDNNTGYDHDVIVYTSNGEFFSNGEEKSATYGYYDITLTILDGATILSQEKRHTYHCDGSTEIKYQITEIEAEPALNIGVTFK